MKESSEEEKQSYLREHIINKGYDPNEFMDYFKESTGTADLNLNDYTMQEIIEVVNGFYSKKGESNIQQNDTYHQIPQELKSECEQDNNNNNENSNSNSSGHLNENGVEEIIQCVQIEKTEISKIPELKIRIVFPEKVEPGIFSKPYMSYTVQANPIGLTVKKRYSDFEWLHKVLTEHFINCIVPPLCKKNYIEQFNEDFISKRARALERFMNGIAIHPILRNSYIFYDFISIKDADDFKQKKIMHEQPFLPKRINDFNNENGQIKVNLSNENEIYFQNILDNIDMNETLMEEIIKGYKNLFEIIKKLNEKIIEIGYLWKKIEFKSKKFYEHSNIVNSYKYMKEYMKDWAEMNKRQIVEFSENIVENLRYMKNEYSNFKPFAERVKEKKELFFKEFDEFYSKNYENKKKDWSIPEKIEAFNETDFTQLSTMNTQNLIEVKNFYCGYLHSFTSEYERIKNLNSKKIKGVTKNLTNSLCKDFTQFVEICQGRLSNYESTENEGNSSEELFKDNSSVSLIK